MDQWSVVTGRRISRRRGPRARAGLHLCPDHRQRYGRVGEIPFKVRSRALRRPAGTLAVAKRSFPQGPVVGRLQGKAGKVELAEPETSGTVQQMQNERNSKAIGGQAPVDQRIVRLDIPKSVNRCVERNPTKPKQEN